MTGNSKEGDKVAGDRGQGTGDRGQVAGDRGQVTVKKVTGDR